MRCAAFLPHPAFYSPICSLQLTLGSRSHRMSEWKHSTGCTSREKDIIRNKKRRHPGARTTRHADLAPRLPAHIHAVELVAVLSILQQLLHLTLHTPRLALACTQCRTVRVFRCRGAHTLVHEWCGTGHRKRVAQQGKARLLWVAAAAYPATHTPCTPPHCNTTHTPAPVAAAHPPASTPSSFCLMRSRARSALALARLMAPPAPATVAGATPQSLSSRAL